MKSKLITLFFVAIAIIGAAYAQNYAQLLNTDSRKTLAQLIKERYDTYALADITVETVDENIHKTLAKVLNAIQQHDNVKNKRRTK